MPAHGDHVPLSDHLLRYISKKYFDKETGQVEGAGFLARQGEGAPSANWMECFSFPLENQVLQIRCVKRLTYEKRGRLARINVGQTIQHVADNADTLIQLSFVHDELQAAENFPADPSHVLMHGVPELFSSEADFIGDLLRETIVDLIEPVPG